MLKHTRVTGIMDVGRLAEAVSGPGIDPRTWLSFGVVTAIGSDAEGFFADTTMVPGMVKVPARVGMSYAGPGFGESSPVGVDDEVVVVIPDGNPANGGVVVARLWSASDAPPSDVLDNPDDRVLVMKPGQSYRLGVSNGGGVFLGQTTASDAAVRGTTYRSAEDSRFAAMDAFAEAVGVVLVALQSAAPTLTGSPSQIAAYTAAMTAMQNALGVYETALATWGAESPEFLSSSVKVGQ